MNPDSKRLYHDGFRIHPLLRTALNIIRSEWVHGKREWTCVECQRKIYPREYYLNFVWTDNQMWHTANYCEECALLFGLRLIAELAAMNRSESAICP
jgi:hypothetical protein